MATPKIIPRTAGEGSLGAATHGWGGLFVTNITASSATEGGKMVLAANDGAVMADNHRLGVIEFKGAEDGSNTLTNGARIQAIADATWSASENGASLEFYTTDGNASESVALTLDSNNLATFAGKIAGPIEIEQGSTGGGDCLHIDNDDRDQISLKINSENTTVPILDIESAYLSSGTGINVNLDGLTTGRGINLDIDDNQTASADRTLINLDYDSFGICATGETIGTTGLNISLEDSVTNVGTVNHTGINIGLDFDNAGGTLTQKGIVMAVGADGVGDTASGIEMEVLDGGTDIKMMSSADTADYCSITTTANGATTITTVDGGAAAANFEVAADGDITLDAAGNIVLETGTTSVNSTDIPLRKYSLPSSTVGDYSGGDVYYYGSGSTVKGSIYYMASGGGWTLADADAVASASGLLAVALGTDPDVDGMLLRGFVTLLTEVEGTEAIGSVLYLSATDTGIATITAPTGTGDIVRVLGYSLHATDNQVYFSPDNTFVELA